jgi:hypothetical protein
MLSKRKTNISSGEEAPFWSLSVSINVVHRLNALVVTGAPERRDAGNR